MPRMYRVDWNGALHHVMARGVQKSSIFRSDHDRISFIDRLGRCVEDTDVGLLAWSLMPNHIHLLVRTGAIPLSKFMQKLLTGHSIYFNHRYDRTGHLFQGRYLSILVQTEKYMLQLVRYIHLNPVKAGLVKDLDALASYPWTGHSGILDAGKYPWQDRNTVLKEINGNNTDKTDGYVSFMLNDDGSGDMTAYDTGKFVFGSNGIREVDSVEIKTGFQSQFRVLGDRHYTDSVYRRLLLQGYGNLRNRHLQHDRIGAVLDHACGRWKISREILCSGAKRKEIVRAREFVCHVLVNLLGVGLSDCSRITGISTEGVRKSAERYCTRDGTSTSISEITRLLKL